MIIIALEEWLIPLAGFPPQSNKQNVCGLQTSLGKMAFKFSEADVPQSVNPFQKFVRDGFYNGKDF